MWKRPNGLRAKPSAPTLNGLSMFRGSEPCIYSIPRRNLLLGP
jgi:hypothetical protein